MKRYTIAAVTAAALASVVLSAQQAARPMSPEGSTHAQVISGGWGADYPTASDFIELKLSCREYRPQSDFNNNIGFCDPAVDRQIDRAIALQVARPPEANTLWGKIDHELSDRAVWLPTVTPKTADFVSKRVGNYQFHPLWGVLVDQLWVR